MPYLGDFRILNPADKEKYDKAKNYYEQLKVMGEMTEFEVWDGEKWVSGNPFYSVAIEKE